MSNFLKFKLNESLIKTLEEIGFEKPTAIQSLAIPKVLEGVDLIASAQTGTGKTAAFLLPALHKLKQEPTKSKGPQVLVLVPTRELAMQVAGEAERFSKNLSRVKTVCIYGGIPYPMQKRALSRPFEILVATPGRLIDHLNRGRLDLSSVKMLVLDEADRMLDMGFINDVETIASATPKSRQTLLFSATLDKKILSISKKLQNSPHEIKSEENFSVRSNIEQRLYFVDNIQHKVRLLDTLLEEKDIKQAIIFTSTKSQADILSEELNEKGNLSAALHGDMDQSKRTRTINKLRQGKIRLLVATDVAARGIDVTTITHVINFDLPYNPEDFIHRIGRTGRGEASGIAITFAAFREEKFLFRISKLTGQPMKPLTIQGMEPTNKSQNHNRRRFANGKRQKPRPFTRFNKTKGRPHREYKTLSVK